MSKLYQNSKDKIYKQALLVIPSSLTQSKKKCQNQFGYTDMISFLVDYNPVTALLNKLTEKAAVLADAADYLFPKNDPNLQKALFLLGVAALTYKIASWLHKTVSLFSWLPSHFVNAKRLTAANLKRKYGDCFVAITGFTEGIGRAYAELFAEMGFNLLLIGIDKPTVDSKVAELSQLYKDIRIESFFSDFSFPADLQALQGQFNRFSDLDIGIVVNNAGTISGGEYFEIDSQHIQRDMKVDLLTIFIINRILVPRLRKREHNRSAIINMSSSTGCYLSCSLGVYSSVKKSVDIYSRVLSLDNSDKIDVISVRPFGVGTGMMRMKKGNVLFIVNPRECVSGVLADLLGGETTTWSHLSHKMGSSLVYASLNEEQAFATYENALITLFES